MTLNSPLDLHHLDRLIERAVTQTTRDVVDHGCGWGEVLLRVVAATSDATGLGVEPHGPDLVRARAAAEERGLGARVSFVQGSSADHRRAADVLISLGAYQAFGDVETALSALRDDLRSGGRALFGLEYWTQIPTEDELSFMWPDASVEDCVSLADLVDQVHAAGWRIIDMHDSTRTEFDTFEIGHFRQREEWLVAHPGEFAQATRAELDRAWTAWLRGHRRSMGFVTFVLA